MTGTMRLINVTSQPQRLQTFLVDTGAFQLVNSDIVNQIYIGNDPISQVIPIPPLGSASLTADKHDIWVSTNGGSFNVSAYLMPGGTNWTPSPAQVAAQINALGLATSANQGTQIGQGTSLVSNTGSTNVALFGSAPSALVSASGLSVAQDMKNSHSAVTAEIAALIATGAVGGTPGGVPLLRKTVNLGFSNPSISILASGIAQLASSNTFNQPGYEMFLSANLPAASGTKPFIEIQVTWTDIASGMSLSTDLFYIACGNGAANAIPAYIFGPVKGDAITVNALNQDPGFAATLVYSVNVNSHVYTRPYLLQPSYVGAPNGFTSPAGIPAAGELINASPSIGPGATSSRLCAAWNGRVRIHLDNLAGANAAQLTVTDPSTLYSSNSGADMFALSIAAASAFEAEFHHPSGPVVYNVKNTGGAGNISPVLAVTKEEY